MVKGLRPMPAQNTPWGYRDGRYGGEALCTHSDTNRGVEMYGVKVGWPCINIRYYRYYRGVGMDWVRVRPLCN